MARERAIAPLGLLLVCLVSSEASSPSSAARGSGGLVCGEDGRTYDNEHSAGKRGIKVACRRGSSGACPPSEQAHVCGEDGEIYCTVEDLTVAGAAPAPCASRVRALRSTDREAGMAAEQREATDLPNAGEAPAPAPAQPAAAAAAAPAESVRGCVCADLREPVCGGDGRTYGNACKARCARQAIGSTGPCPKDEEEDEGDITNAEVRSRALQDPPTTARNDTIMASFIAFGLCAVFGSTVWHCLRSPKGGEQQAFPEKTANPDEEANLLTARK